VNWKKTREEEFEDSRKQTEGANQAGWSKVDFKMDRSTKYKKWIVPQKTGMDRSTKY
jgi:hypothetical protein